MAKKAARKSTKTVTKKTVSSKPMVKTMPKAKKEENYLPLLLIILAAALFFLWLVVSTQTAPQSTATLSLPAIEESTLEAEALP